MNLWPFGKRSEAAPLPAPVHEEVRALLADLNALVKIPPRRSLFESFGPYAQKAPPLDAISEASVYVAYGYLGQAADILSKAADSPEEAALMDWLDNPQDVLRTLASRAREIVAQVDAA